MNGVVSTEGHTAAKWLRTDSAALYNITQFSAGEQSWLYIFHDEKLHSV